MQKQYPEVELNEILRAIVEKRLIMERVTRYNKAFKVYIIQEDYSLKQVVVPESVYFKKHSNYKGVAYVCDEVGVDKAFKILEDILKTKGYTDDLLMLKPKWHTI